MANNILQNNVMMTMLLSKDLPDDQRRTSFLSSYMLGEAQNGFLAQMVNIRQLDELNNKVKNLEKGRNESIATADTFVVETVSEILEEFKDSPQKKVEASNNITPFVANYVRKVHNKYVPVVFKNLDDAVLEILKAEKDLIFNF